MESWRERGFVPDSDDEDGFDSEEKEVTLDTATTRDSNVAIVVSALQKEDSVELAEHEGHEKDTVNSQRRDDARDNNYEDMEEEPDAVVANGDMLAPDDDDEVDLLPLPLPHERPRTPDDEVGQGREGTVVKDKGTIHRESSRSRTPTDLPTVTENDPSSTPRPKQQRDFWDIPSSSQDQLQLDRHPWRRQTSPASIPTPKAQEASQPRPQDENVQRETESSPLSSPLSSPRSSILDEFEQPEQQQRIEESNPTLEERLPPLEISEDLQQLEPSRRAFRQRNPIQLHPYVLEDAKYRTLMKARGLKPVPIPRFSSPPRAAADESQGQDLRDDAGSTSDSQMTGLQYIPSSPLDTRELFGLAPIDGMPENGDRQARQQRKDYANHAGPRSPKRRRVLGPGDERQRQRLRPVPRPAPPQVVIDNVSSSIPDASSIFDVPSPPLSASVSSPPVQKSIGPRVPLDSPSPVNTPRAAMERTENINETIVIDEDENRLGHESDDARTVRSASPSDSDLGGAEEEEVAEDAQEAIVRRYQRRIKGVLPASWLRLDQQKQKGVPGATQRQNDRTRRLETEAAKGVARKITKKPTFSVPSSARDGLSSLRHLAEESDQEGDMSDDTDSIRNPEQDLARWFGLEDSALHQEPLSDGDIPEDNQIDYMFPTASRNHTSAGRKRVKKRSRPEADGMRPSGESKKPRLKRQARLTDAIYRGHRKKKPSQSLPRLGILDAPDVASKSRQEQPQFLRIAARKARSRQDKGRRSPSRKVIRLNSRFDTEDANASLREWRSGRMRQTTLPRVPSQTPRRQPLRDLSTNARQVFNGLNAKRTMERNESGTRQAAPRGNISAATENVFTSNATSTDSQRMTLLENDNTVEENVPTINAPPDPRSNAHGAATRPIQRRQGNAWIIQRNLAISSLSRNNLRPAVPETESHRIIARPPSSLQRSLALLARDDRLPLNRYLSGKERHSDFSSRTQGHPPPEIAPPAINEIDKPNPPVAGSSRPRQVKKRQPRRVDLTHIEDFFSPEVETAETPTQSTERLPHSRSVGQLNRFRTAYSVDFDVSPLQAGTFFHESTLIGSGEFSRSLDVSRRDLDKGSGFLQLQLGDERMRWGAWDDSVSSQLGIAFDKILESAGASKPGEDSANTLSSIPAGQDTYRAVIKYVSETLSFVDQVDRAGFVTRANGLLTKLMEELSIMISATEYDTEQLMKIGSHNVVFANQVCQIASHSLVNQSIQIEVLNLTKSASRQVITLISSQTGQACLRRFLSVIKQRKLQEEGIKNDHPTVEAYVIVRHVLSSADRFRGCLEDYVASACSLMDPKSTEKDIESLESGWQQVFTTLPLQEIDALGISRVGSRFQGGNENWVAVKQLLRPAFESDEASSGSRPVSYYSYCRVLFHRCFILINDWGWRDCKVILDTLYDFFAKRTLHNLDSEENHKSPAFLDELDGNPSFQVLPGDPCFHILLKILASGLRFLTKAHDTKKIRNYTWRLLPNHGRDYPKEQPVHRSDLDALRNHHDLLCTLYSSVPDGCRPRLGTIKELIHPATSHRETCKISLRTWTRLARFKLSTKEDISGLEPFAEWHGYFVTEFLKQHSLARKEIEAQNDDSKRFSQELIDRTVVQNQRQIESLLKTALHGLQSVIKSAPSLEHAQKIVSQTPIKSILDLFDSRTVRLNATVFEGLQVIIIYLQKCSSLSSSSTVSVGNPSISADEDSQDYGDWADIEAVYGYEPSPISPGVEHVQNVFHPAVSRLVSNCFGDDRCPDDSILEGVVDCWTYIAHVLVKHRLRRWDSYISPYEADSWVALRWTTQTRKFTPQFLAQCIEKDGDVLSECKVQAFGIWLSSLVERVSMLKFQHCFTEAILNRSAEDPLLRNLPFSRDRKGERFSITIKELSERRLSLISSLLSNMRVHVQDLDDAKSRELSTTRQDYREIIQKMMSSMKSNYQELGNGETEVKGAYVAFVQRIVGFLQQHTRDICPIDPFFTDTATFPLPSNDPLYIVARLKSYEPKLSSAKVTKALIVFVQGVSERAAIDGEQVYLVDQLSKSMENAYETGSPDQPTLRATLLQGVFPAYLATAFSNGAAWILSRPIIKTIARVFNGLLVNMDATDPDCVSSILNSASATLESSYKALRRIMTDTDMLNQPTVLITTTAFLEMITSTLPVIDYLDRIATDTNSTKQVMAQIRAFQILAMFIASQLRTLPQQTAQTALNFATPPGVSSFVTSDLSAIATRELETYLNESWSRHQGKYYFTRRGAHAPQEIEIEAPISAELDHYPEQGLLNAATAFLEALGRLDLFGEDEEGDMVDYPQPVLSWKCSDELLVL
ncbi:uncharacterized protein DSM5745_02097 [Aspergillus mulundensis]|uniref:Mus7/MMS22 family-domain-containing protein n=1 Tax=Aspergillus mulundensis TaxID=1810919 RepID=A0A3D8SVH8_9EURO|nr:Uncharacterized protein DSM5745_02097 [Aspergillus mulundensis]RDW90322.1 Uncharacterized protein DSM5745_02097 [Aspergillus mulundensis]